MKVKYTGKKDHQVIKFGKVHLRLSHGETSPELSDSDVEHNCKRFVGLEVIGEKTKVIEPKKVEKKKPKNKSMAKKAKDKNLEESAPVEMESSLEEMLAAQDLAK